MKTITITFKQQLVLVITILLSTVMLSSCSGQIAGPDAGQVSSKIVCSTSFLTSAIVKRMLLIIIYQMILRFIRIEVGEPGVLVKKGFLLRLFIVKRCARFVIFKSLIKLNFKFLLKIFIIIII